MSITGHIKTMNHLTIHVLLAFCLAISVQGIVNNIPIIAEGSGEGYLDGVSDGGQLANHSLTPQTTVPDCAKLDVVVLVDSSGSIESYYEQQKKLAEQIADLLPIGVDSAQMAAVQYAGYPWTDFGLAAYDNKLSIQGHLRRLRFRAGVTRIGLALSLAEKELFTPQRGGRIGVNKVVVLMTDGLSMDDPLPIAAQLRAFGVRIYAISLAPDPFRSDLFAVAGSPNRVFFAGQTEQLLNRLRLEINEAERYCGLISQLDSQHSGNGESTGAPTTAPVDAPENTTAILPTTVPVVENTTDTSSEEMEFIHYVNETASISSSAPSDLANTTHAAANTSATYSTTTVGPIDPVTISINNSINTTDIEIASYTDEPHTNDTNEAFFWHGEAGAMTELNSSLETEFLDANHSMKPADGNGSAISEIDLESLEILLGNVSLPNNYEFDVTNISVLANFTVAGNETRELHSSGTTLSSTPSEFAPFFEIEFAANQTSNESSTVALNIDQRAARLIALTDIPAISGNVTRHCPVDILFIMDSSGSIQAHYEAQREFVRGIVDLLTIGPAEQRVALVQFSGTLLQRTEFAFDQYDTKEGILEAIDNLQLYRGTTALGRALEFAEHVLETRKWKREHADTIVICVTDGFSQDDPGEAAQRLRLQPRTEIYTISLAAINDHQFLVSITGEPSHVVLKSEVDTFKKLLKNEHLLCRRN